MGEVRFIYSALGSVGRVTINWLVGVSTAVAARSIPCGSVQAEQFVRPSPRHGVRGNPQRPDLAVVVHPDSSYYGRDLVRNDPFLRNSPKLFFAPVLADSGIEVLSGRFGGRVHQLRSTELARLGIKTF